LFSLPATHRVSSLSQGDQIGRIFANWSIVFFGQIFKITEEAKISDLLISSVKSYLLSLTKKWIRQNFGQYFQKLIWSPLLLTQISSSSRVVSFFCVGRSAAARVERAHLDRRIVGSTTLPTTGRIRIGPSRRVGLNRANGPGVNVPVRRRAVDFCGRNLRCKRFLGKKELVCGSTVQPVSAKDVHIRGNVFGQMARFFFRGESKDFRKG
jgi:hypothetical protein